MPLPHVRTFGYARYICTRLLPSRFLRSYAVIFLQLQLRYGLRVYSSTWLLRTLRSSTRLPTVLRRSRFYLCVRVRAYHITARCHCGSPRAFAVPYAHFGLFTYVYTLPHVVVRSSFAFARVPHVCYIFTFAFGLHAYVFFVRGCRTLLRLVHLFFAVTRFAAYARVPFYVLRTFCHQLQRSIPLYGSVHAVGWILPTTFFHGLIIPVLQL